MNSRGLTLFLVALNVALLGAVGYMVYLLQAGPGPAPAVVKTKIVTNTVTQIAVRKVNATNLLLAALASRPLSWAALESTNYPTYISNLRAFGCPEETVRDIIITDVAKLYSKRRGAIRAQGQPYQFWRTGDAAENPEVRKALLALETEQRALIKQLLGVDYHAEIAKYWSEEDLQERMYGFLSPEKRTQVQSLQQRFDEAEQDLYARTKGVLLDEDQEKLKAFEIQREAELAKVLTPEELEEYELRNSNVANSMRAQLAGFEPTEEEFRTIFRLQKTFESSFNRTFDATDDTQTEIRARAQDDAQAALHDEIKRAIGEKRFAEYQRAQDGDYRAVAQITDRFELPKDVAGQVYDMKRVGEQQLQRVLDNPNLTYAQRQAAASALAQELERSVAKTMGDNVFKAYQKSGGQWIRNLASIPEPPPAPPPTPQFPPFPPGLTPLPPGFIRVPIPLPPETR